MSRLEELRQSLPEAAKDIKLNLQSVLQQTSLSPAQAWGTAVASAIASRNPRLVEAVIEDARPILDATCSRTRRRRRR